MSNPAVMPDDVERLVVDFLAANIDEATVTVRVGVAPNYRPSSTDRLLVVDSVTPLNDWPVATRPTVRLTAYAENTTEAKRIAAKAAGVMHTANTSFGQTELLTGPDPARDTDTFSEIATVSLSVAVRTIEIP